MPVLPNSKHERFAYGLSKGWTAGDAYEKAGYKRNDGNASRLKGNEKIKARVAEIQGLSIEMFVIDRKWILDELVDTYKCAKAAEQNSAANQSLKLLGMEIANMFVERKEIGPAGAFDRMTKQELAEYIEREAAQLGLRVPQLKLVKSA